MAVLPITDDDTGPRTRWERWIGWGVVGVATAVVLAVVNPEMNLVPLRLHLWTPDVRWESLHSGLLFADTTTAGGDMGAHVWWPDFLRDHWFPQLRLSGWAPDWYAGFPAGQYYFPLPAVLVAMLDVVLPYNVAFKLVTVSGPLLMPAAAYQFARGLRAPWPAPPAFAIAATAVLMHSRWTIYGGNLASTLAGEFSFTLAIALALFFLGALGRALDNGKALWLPALLLAAVVLTHLIVAAFAGVGAVMIWLVRKPWRTWAVALPIAGTAALLSAVWWVPMLLRQHYTTNMRYEKVTAWMRSSDGHWHLDFAWWMLLLAGIAIVAAGWWRRGATLVLLVMTLAFAGLFRIWPEHHVWNTRFLPFYLLSLSFLVAMGAVELGRFIGYWTFGVVEWVLTGGFAGVDERDVRDDVDEYDRYGHTRPAPELVSVGGDRWAPDATAAHDDGPGERWAPPEPWTPPELAARPRAESPELVLRRSRVLSIVLAIGLVLVGGFALNRVWNSRGYVPGWASWNYGGYEARPAWPEVESIIETMDALPPGRVLWEPSEHLGNYGTPLALELLPYWTDGRIASMEGLYFESAATTPFHFLTVAELSKQPSNPVRGLRYGSVANDFDRGVRHMQMLGVRYFLAQSSEAIAAASAHPELEQVAAIPDLDNADPKGWKVYEITGTALVEGLRYTPVVADVHAGTTSECYGEAPPQPGTRDPELNAWECAAAPWFADVDALDRPFTDDGPDEWRRVDVDDLASTRFERLPPVEVTDAELTYDRIRFRVSQPGVPVVVKASYFPNWEVEGARGPYRLAPNLMVVIPTGNEVTLRYAFTPVDWLGRILTFLGLGALVALILWRPRPAFLARPKIGTEPSPPPSGGERSEPEAAPAGSAAPGIPPPDEQPEREPSPALP